MLITKLIYVENIANKFQSHRRGVCDYFFSRKQRFCQVFIIIHGNISSQHKTQYKNVAFA